jgi:kynurenine formamidase
MPRIIDLSQEIYQGMGVYPGHLKTVIWEHAGHAETRSKFEGGFSFQLFPVHMMCRANGITHYENLCNLDQLVNRRFTFFGFPLRIRGGTGSPVRAVAILDE